MGIITTFLIKYGTEVVAGGIIMAIRYIERTAIVKGYRKKINDIRKANEKSI
jgi:hypothetical protein